MIFVCGIYIILFATVLMYYYLSIQKSKQAYNEKLKKMQQEETFLVKSKLASQIQMETPSLKLYEKIDILQKQVLWLLQYQSHLREKE